MAGWRTATSVFFPDRIFWCHRRGVRVVDPASGVLFRGPFGPIQAAPLPLQDGFAEPSGRGPSIVCIALLLVFSQSSGCLRESLSKRSNTPRGKKSKPQDQSRTHSRRSQQRRIAITRNSLSFTESFNELSATRPFPPWQARPLAQLSSNPSSASDPRSSTGLSILPWSTSPSASSSRSSVRPTARQTASVSRGRAHAGRTMTYVGSLV